MNRPFLARAALALGIAAVAPASAVLALSTQVELTGYSASGNFGSRIISGGPVIRLHDQVGDVGSDGAVWSATPVPEPATALIFVAGLLALLTKISPRTRDATPCRPSC